MYMESGKARVMKAATPAAQAKRQLLAHKQTLGLKLQTDAD